MLMSNLKDRIVLVGGDLSDHSDRHPTPISKLIGEPMPGVAIHAQAVAQHLDGRHLGRIAPWLEQIVTFVMAFAGFLLGWRFRVNSWITVTIPVILLLGVSATFLAASQTIVPFAEPALAWAAAAVTGRAAMWLLGRRRYPSYEAS
jgi:adenylate cyclase